MAISDSRERELKELFRRMGLLAEDEEDEADLRALSSRMGSRGGGGVYPQSLAPLQFLRDMNPSSRILNAILNTAEIKTREAKTR